MNNFTPRQNIPHPKTLNVEPPTYTVPDVTLMFDSDDSLIWKAGERNNVFIREKGGDQHQPRIIKHINIRKENASVPFISTKENSSLNKEIPKRDQKIYVTPLKPSNNVLPLTNRAVYNPQVYASPIAVRKDSLTSGASQPQIVPHEKQEYDRGTGALSYPQSIVNILKHKPCSHNQVEEKIATNSEELPQFGTSLNPEYYKGTSIPPSRRVGFYSPDSKSPSNSPKQNTGLNNDTYILKLIEGQNQQISYLHKVLEKVLDQSNTERHEMDVEENHCKHCPCNKTEANKKIAIVQTSFLDEKPETKSVATNTDISWDDILSSLQNKDNSNCKHRGFAMFSKTNEAKQFYETSEGSPLRTSAKRDVSLAPKGLDMETICDPVSPEPSLHLNVPEYQDDQCPIDDYNPRTKKYNDAEGKIGSEVTAHDSPLVGESAMLYNERHRQQQNQVMMQRVVEETSQEDNNGVTFYNNIMISIKQILQKTNANEKEENSLMEKKDHGERNNEILTTPPRTRPPTNQLQMQRVSKVLDALYMPGHLQGLTRSELEIVDRPRWERPPVPSNHITDAQLLAVAQRSPEGIGGPSAAYYYEPRVAQPSNKYASNVDRHDSDFSFATTQFLGKYQLDK